MFPLYSPRCYFFFFTYFLKLFLPFFALFFLLSASTILLLILRQRSHDYDTAMNCVLMKIVSACVCARNGRCSQLGFTAPVVNFIRAVFGTNAARTQQVLLARRKHVRVAQRYNRRQLNRTSRAEPNCAPFPISGRVELLAEF